jgi:hypothetical protein
MSSSLEKRLISLSMPKLIDATIQIQNPRIGQNDKMHHEVSPKMSINVI